MTSALSGLAVTLCYALGLVGYRMLKRPPAVARRFEPASHGSEQGPEPLLPRVVEYLSRRLAGRVLPLLGTARRQQVEHRLHASGSSMTLRQYAGRKAAYTVLGAGSGMLLFIIAGNPVLIFAMAGAGWFGHDLALARRAKRRQAQIDRDLPDFLDILSVVVGAGLGFRAGMARVAETLGGPLAEEITLTLRQIDLGISRYTAFQGLRDRNDSKPLGNFVSALLQAEDLGAPLTDMLDEIALDMRREFQQNARRVAAQAAPRVSLIVVMVIVPAAVILIITALFVGAEINIGDMLG